MDLKYQIQLLEKQVAELELQNDALSQKLRAAQHEVEALAASAWAMASKLKEVCKLVNTDAGSSVQWILDNHAEVGQLALATPQQHMRDVRAEAGRAGFVAGYSKGWNDFDDVNGFRREPLADQYAERVKAGEK